MIDPIRKVEKIIDEHHKSCSALTYTKGTAILNALRIFEDGCRYGPKWFTKSNDHVESWLNSHNNQDALNTAIFWISKECKCGQLDKSLDKKIYREFAILHFQHAHPYSVLCSLYTNYSRNKLTAHVDEKCIHVTFNEPNDEYALMSDRLSTVANQVMLYTLDEQIQEVKSTKELVESIAVQKRHIYYKYSDKIWSAFRVKIEKQWDDTSELPNTWEFDSFSLNSYRSFWIGITTFAKIHYTACSHSSTKGAGIDDMVIIGDKEYYADIVTKRENIQSSTCIKIIDYLTYDENIKNNDVMFQPFLLIDKNTLALSPSLLLGSRPERNLITLIHKKKDSAYFRLTNYREGIMLEQLQKAIMTNEALLSRHCVRLPNSYPDIDYTLYDRLSGCVLLCELKWLTEADSVQEVMAREEDFEHGCKQIKKILEYALSNPSNFMSLVFNENENRQYSFFACVISKKGIHISKEKIPIITLESFIELFHGNGACIKSVIDRLEKRTYLPEMPPGFNYSNRSFDYAGYTFSFPAYSYNSESE